MKILGRIFSGLTLLVTGVGNVYAGEPKINVPVSEMIFSEGRVLESNDFSVCSAVILDYEDSAVLAHSKVRKNSTESFDSTNVVDYLREVLLRKGIDPKKSKAIVNSGFKGSLNSILRQLEYAEIPVVYKKLDPNFRDIEYNPRTDKLRVIYK
jgi:hypothetical protein